MAYSVAQLTARVREHMSGFPPDYALNDAGDSIVLGIVNEAHLDVAKHGNALSEEIVPLLLVTGVARYALDPTVVRINAATYLERLNDQGYPLRDTSIDELDHREKGWRNVGTGTPYAYYRDGSYIGLQTAPNRTSVGGYPFLALAVVRAVPFDSVTDLLPDSIIDLDPYVEACKFRYGLRGQADAVPQAAQLSAAALANMRRDMQGTLIRQKARAVARVPRIGR